MLRQRSQLTLHGYFEVLDHKVETRNDLCLLKLPKIRNEYAGKSLHLMVAKIYNELPSEIRKAETFNGFVKLLKKHLS